jgi:hypothetical protein
VNVGAIKWPPQLQEDAFQHYNYNNPEILNTLFVSHSGIIAIIVSRHSTAHLIWADYEECQ